VLVIGGGLLVVVCALCVCRRRGRLRGQARRRAITASFFDACLPTLTHDPNAAARGKADGTPTLAVHDTLFGGNDAGASADAHDVLDVSIAVESGAEAAAEDDEAEGKRSTVSRLTERKPSFGRVSFRKERRVVRTVERRTRVRVGVGDQSGTRACVANEPAAALVSCVACRLAGNLTGSGGSSEASHGGEETASGSPSSSIADGGTADGGTPPFSVADDGPPISVADDVTPPIGSADAVGTPPISRADDGTRPSSSADDGTRPSSSADDGVPSCAEQGSGSVQQGDDSEQKGNESAAPCPPAEGRLSPPPEGRVSPPADDRLDPLAEDRMSVAAAIMARRARPMAPSSPPSALSSSTSVAAMACRTRPLPRASPSSSLSSSSSAPTLIQRARTAHRRRLDEGEASPRPSACEGVHRHVYTFHQPAPAPTCPPPVPAASTLASYRSSGRSNVDADPEQSVAGMEYL